MFEKLDELPDEVVNEISEYFDEMGVVYGLLVSCKRFFEFLYDVDGRIEFNYGKCCKNVQFMVSDKKDLEMIERGKHFVCKLQVFCAIDDNQMKCLRFIDDLSFFRINTINDNGLHYLSKNIKKLLLKNCSHYGNSKITNEGLKYLVNFPNLHTLLLNRNYQISSDGIKYLSNLHTLDLNECKNIDDIGLMNFQHSTNLYSLNIGSCPNVTNKGLKYISHLHTLDIHNNDNITDNGIVHLSKIHTLDISDCQNITDNGMVHLSNVHTLDISGCSNITNEGLKSFTNVFHLEINYNRNITCNGLKYLSSTIKVLGINSCNNITDSSRRRILKKYDI